MESEEMVLVNLFSGQQWKNRHGEQTYGQWEERREKGRCMERVTEIHKTICKIDSQWESAL